MKKNLGRYFWCVPFGARISILKFDSQIFDEHDRSTRIPTLLVPVSSAVNKVGGLENVS